MARRKSIERDRILDAVEEVIARHGAGALTLDLVAAQASISKGGLTYSFATKAELLSALLERDVARFKAHIESFAQKHATMPRPELTGLIENSRRSNGPIRAKAENMLAALMHAPEAVDSTRTLFDWIMAKCARPDDRRARIAVMALFGVFFTQGMGLVKLPSAAHGALFDDLLRLVSRKPF